MSRVTLEVGRGCLFPLDKHHEALIGKVGYKQKYRLLSLAKMYIFQGGKNPRVTEVGRMEKEEAKASGLWRQRGNQKNYVRIRSLKSWNFMHSRM